MVGKRRALIWFVALGVVLVGFVGLRGEDRYEPPKDADVPALVEFIEAIQQFEPSSAEEFLAHRQNMIPAIGKAAKRILELETDKTSESYRLAKGFLLQIDLLGLDEATPEQRRQLVARVVAETDFENPLPADLGAVQMTVQALEYSGDTELAVSTMKLFAEKLAGAENEQIAGFAKFLEASARRLDLPGNELVLKGTKLDGSAFDLKELRGKVVLVDVWATWCGPCRAEYPNLVEQFEAFGDKGFEIVGVSVDEDREALEEYLAENQVPWTILHGEEGQNDSLEFYGISALPTMILVGKDGKVLSIEARGDALRELLVTQFGEPEPKPEAAEPGADPAASSEESGAADSE